VSHDGKSTLLLQPERQRRGSGPPV